MMGLVRSVYLGKDEWNLITLNISHLIGDTVIDLTKAWIPTGETTIYISQWIGDVKVYVPNDLGLEVKVIAHTFYGTNQAFERTNRGINCRIVREQRGY
ncbi:cell wall-active antibiotics response protein LiaF [Cohnella silvisoli]|uniref:Cell wall-active antibiotics response protein LiaF n=1 Tax=Cohnella silvisoli TaxID=2873699 RepID=A0ABV1KNY0_9BACL|nr:cell wall-active antibiotics response protein LiaF [Cohnella silvisoli]